MKTSFGACRILGLSGIGSQPVVFSHTNLGLSHEKHVRHLPTPESRSESLRPLPQAVKDLVCLRRGFVLESIKDQSISDQAHLQAHTATRTPIFLLSHGIMREARRVRPKFGAFTSLLRRRATARRKPGDPVWFGAAETAPLVGYSSMTQGTALSAREVLPSGPGRHR